MFKKLASMAGAGALMLSLAAPAFGWWWNDDDVTVRNRAYVRNYVTTKADTGDNSVHGKYVFGGLITTGDAGAVSDVLNDANTTLIGCDCVDGDVYLKNKAYVKNKVYTKADTGDNSIHGKVVGGGEIDTGDAGAASTVLNSVNFTSIGSTE